MVVLASNSPRRSELLTQIGVSHEVRPSSINEKDIKLSKGEFYSICLDLAESKAKDIAMKNQKSTVIGADTIVVNKGAIYNKPSDLDDCKEMLKSLSGKYHYVYTGVCIRNISLKVKVGFIEMTKVKFMALNDKDIEFYINNYPVLDKSGGYGIQCYASTFVDQIEGCFFNVVGLPLARLNQELKKIKAIG
mgnify:CR=1 FL=1